MPSLSDGLRAAHIGSQHRRHRITGNEVDHDKGDERDGQQQWEQQQHSPENQGAHGVDTCAPVPAVAGWMPSPTSAGTGSTYWLRVASFKITRPRGSSAMPLTRDW